MRFGKCMGTLGGHWGHLYEVWEVYGDSGGIIGGCFYDVLEVYHMYVVTIGGHRGRLYGVREVYGDSRGPYVLFI